MRLIDAVRLQGEMMEMIHEGYGLEDMVDAVIEAPTVDAAPVCRCRDCLLQRGCKPAQYLGDDGFCSNGERKGGMNDE